MKGDSSAIMTDSVETLPTKPHVTISTVKAFEATLRGSQIRTCSNRKKQLASLDTFDSKTLVTESGLRVRRGATLINGESSLELKHTLPETRNKTNDFEEAVNNNILSQQRRIRKQKFKAESSSQSTQFIENPSTNSKR